MRKKNNYSDWSKEDLIKEVEVLKKHKTYGLVWEEDKTKEIFDEEGKFPVLKGIKSKDVITDRDSTYNLLIEGDVRMKTIILESLMVGLILITGAFLLPHFWNTPLMLWIFLFMFVALIIFGNTVNLWWRERKRQE